MQILYLARIVRSPFLASSSSAGLAIGSSLLFKWVAVRQDQLTISFFFCLHNQLKQQEAVKQATGFFFPQLLLKIKVIIIIVCIHTSDQAKHGQQGRCNCWVTIHALYPDKKDIMTELGRRRRCCFPQDHIQSLVKSFFAGFEF